VMYCFFETHDWQKSLSGLFLSSLSNWSTIWLQFFSQQKSSKFRFRFFLSGNGKIKYFPMNWRILVLLREFAMKLIRWHSTQSISH
jgi:hypothetical protein